MKARDLLVEFYNAENDQLEKRSFDDTRRPRLTLGHIQSLRKSKDVERIETITHKEFLPTMYAPPAEPPM